jgi:hypothetical protein
MDLNNQQVIEKWMKLDRKVKAGVFFQGDELMTIDRRGHILPFASSPFKNNLGECVIYIDDHHTRGTDLKIPVPSHAFVTLGPSLLKDKLVQSCMRMRQLGRGHTICFWASKEVDRYLKKVNIYSSFYIPYSFLKITDDARYLIREK